MLLALRTRPSRAPCLPLHTQAPSGAAPLFVMGWQKTTVLRPRARAPETSEIVQVFQVRPGNPLLTYFVRGLQELYGANTCVALGGVGRPELPILQRMLAPARSSVEGTTLALVNADANLLMRLFLRRLRRSSMFKHRTLIKKFFVTLAAKAPRLIQGCVLRVRGKISVGGNARSRELEFQVGTFSSGQMILRVSARRGLVGTVTGCLGVYLALWY